MKNLDIINTDMSLKKYCDVPNKPNGVETEKRGKDYAKNIS